MKAPLLTGPQDVGGLYPNLNTEFNAFAALVPGLINYSVTAGSNGADNTDDVLQSFTIPAGFLNANGMALRVKAWGVTANNAHTKTLKLKFGATPLVVANVALTASVADVWALEAIIIRATATTQLAMSTVLDSGTGVLGVAQSTSGAETLANALLLSLTGASGSSAANDITCEGWIVEVIQ